MRLQIILVISSLFLFNFGYGQPVISWKDQKKIPIYSHLKELKFKTNAVTKRNHLIDVNSVYIHKVYKENDTLYYFIRFFANGQVFKSDYFIKKPTEQECNTITYGKRGYYSANSNIIKIELYINSYDGYWVYSCEKYDNSFKYVKAKPRFGFGIFLEARRQTKFYKSISPPVKEKIKFYTIANW